MSKLVFLFIAAGLAAAAVAAIHINGVNARQQTEFIQVSVLAEHQADYGVDEQVIAIPAVSVEIVEDAARDFQSQSSVRIITYTPLPAKEPGQDREEQQGSESLDEIRHDNDQGTAIEPGNNGNDDNNGNGNDNENNGNNGNGNGNGNGGEEDKNKDQEKDKDNGNGSGNGNGDGKGNGNSEGNGNGNGDGNASGNGNGNGNSEGNGNANGNGNGNGGGGGNDN